MRILSLHFANINSLAGDWSIDFEDPAFRDGLFALTGPTGSGKTSVLDALSLALYGRTVRQKISKETNEVMTRGAGTARAEVAFETGGRRYLCAWSQHRARAKAGGNLQAAKRSLTSLTDNATLCERLNEMDDAVARVTGMTFDQFTRSVLLAQGQFDAFLKAKDDERSDILEQVTGTEIYSEVGAAVFARYQQERENTALLAQRHVAIHVLDAEARDALLRERDAALDLKQSLDLANARLQREHAWLESLTGLRAQRSKLLDEQAALAARLHAAQPALERLARATAARAVDAAYARLTAARQAAAHVAKDVQTRAAGLKINEARRAALAPRVAEAAETARAAQDKQERMRPLWQQTRTLDQTCAVAAGELKAAEAAQAETLSQVQRAQADARALEQAIAAWRDERSAADHVRAGQTAVPLTAAQRGLPLVKAALAAAEAARAGEAALPALASLRAARDAAATAKTEAEKERALRRPDLEVALARARENVALVERMASLEEQRSLLREGERCPLCGATSHPFATGEPLPKLTGARVRLNETEQILQHLERRNEAARQAAEAAECAYRRQESDVQTLQQAITLAQQRFEVAQAELNSRIEAGEASLAKQRAQQEALIEELGQRRAERQRRALALDALKAERQALFAGDPDAEETRLREAADAAKSAHDGLIARQMRLDEAIQNDRRELGLAETRRDETAREAAVLTAELAASWTAAGFADEARWAEARWTDEGVTQTRQLKEDLAAAGSELKGRLADNATSLRQKEADALTVQTLDELAAEWAVKRQALEAQVQRVADLQAALRIDDEAAARRRGQGDALEAQKVLFAKWESLNGWIGGENGMRFKRYAQGITLRRLLQVANPHLARMTRDRYEMVWDPASPELVPEMIDREQGDVRRAASNLSGGETFLVSLALALGLSNMASGRLQVDSLFLDEGFGTLDEDALDTALETLAGLQRQGKLIGIISHVPAIKERIRTQIQIQPQAGGRSILRGAGVISR